MVDVALALLGRLNQQLQLLALAFPAKMLTALVVLSWVSLLFPRILMESSGHAWAAARQILGI
jgi:flagellar biosynthesis protein FliR